MDSETYQFTIDVDELVDFELYSPTSGTIQLVPLNPEEYEIRIYNNGSELVEFFLDIGDDSPISTNYWRQWRECFRRRSWCLDAFNRYSKWLCWCLFTRISL